MSEKKHKDYFGKLRPTIPPPSYSQTTKKGKKGYERRQSKKELENAINKE